MVDQPLAAAIGIYIYTVWGLRFQGLRREVIPQRRTEVVEVTSNRAYRHT